MAPDPQIYGSALKHTVAALHQHPGLRRNWATRSWDSHLAHWHESRPIQAWLRTIPYRRQPEAPGELLDGAQEFLEAEHDRLAAAWEMHQDALAELPQSARDLAALVFALAADHGPRVLLSNRAAIFGIQLVTGRSYTSLATITTARVVLEKAGIVEATVGQQWAAGHKAKPTQYYLLPSVVREALEASELCPYPAVRGIVHLFPVMTAVQHKAMADYYTALRLRRPNDPATRVQPWEPQEADFATLASLLDAAQAVDCPAGHDGGPVPTGARMSGRGLEVSHAQHDLPPPQAVMPQVRARRPHPRAGGTDSATQPGRDVTASGGSTCGPAPDVAVAAGTRLSGPGRPCGARAARDDLRTAGPPSVARPVRGSRKAAGRVRGPTVKLATQIQDEPAEATSL